MLNASMFMKMKYIIDCSQKKHMLSIIADRDTYGVGYYDKKETIYIFTEITSKQINEQCNQSQYRYEI